MTVLSFKGNSRVVADISDIIDILRQEDGFSDIADYIEQHEKDHQAEIYSLNSDIEYLNEEISRLEDEIDMLECA